jgi:hypothetical protein
MKNQTAKQALVNTQDQATGPVEIDASLLHLIGGGNPKGTWLIGDSLVNVDTVETPNPKGTW